MSTTINKNTKFLLVLVLSLHYQYFMAQESKLEGYIIEALENNQGLKQEQFQLNKSLYALKEARTLFLPDISLQGSYLKAQGGRTIDFPIGDLLNPVYASLNQLTGTSQFPELENQNVQLNPDNFYDAKFHTVLPLINAEIWYNEKIKRQQIDMQQAAINVYKRELIRDVKLAYYRYFQSIQAVKIYEDATGLVDENIRVSESMFRNGVGTATAITRAKTERQKIQTELSSSQNSQKNALAYFNFLLNAPLDRALEIDENEAIEMVQNLGTGRADSRDELVQLKSAKDLYELNLKMKKSNFIPKVNTFLDLGSQGFDFNFDSQSQYYLLGLNLQWDLFAFGQNRYRAQQARADINIIEARTSQTERALQLQEVQASNNYYTAYLNLNSAESQLTLAKTYLKDQDKLFREGQLLYIELLDAQSEFTSANLQRSISLANVKIALAELERSQASYPIQ